MIRATAKGGAAKRGGAELGDAYPPRGASHQSKKPLLPAGSSGKVASEFTRQ